MNELAMPQRLAETYETEANDQVRRTRVGRLRRRSGARRDCNGVRRFRDLPTDWDSTTAPCCVLNGDPATVAAYALQSPGHDEQTPALVARQERDRLSGKSGHRRRRGSGR